jgi:competence protein ComEC
MKLPAIAIAVSFAAGILLAGVSASRLPSSPAMYFAASACVVLASLVLFRIHTASAGAAALLAWCALGAATMRLDALAIPENRVTALVANAELDLGEPLRWQGQLREDPLALPWGMRYVVDLHSVEAAGANISVSGGARLDYFFDPRAPQPSPLRAGDSVEALVRLRPVRNYGDPGAFDYQAFLARQNIYLTGALRSTELLQKLSGPPPNLAQRLARVRGRLLREIDSMLSASPAEARVARAMLLGDRSFLDSEQVEAFQETGAYHVLVVAGLHVGVLAAAILWLGRKLRFGLWSRTATALATILLYAAIVEDRPPIVRAVLMATAFLCGRLLFRRVALLNAVGVAALVILAAKPSELTDASFLLSFLAALTIGGVAAPWLESSAERYRLALDHLTDVTRDAAYAPSIAQFRLDLRAGSRWLAPRLPRRLAPRVNALVTAPCRVALRLWEVLVISAAIQIGMMPLMAQYFHRVAWMSLAANIPAVLLTGIIVPLGFLALGTSLAWRALGMILGRSLAVAIRALIGSVGWFARLSWASYRVPSPPTALLVLFFAAGTILSAAIVLRRRRLGAFALFGLLVLGALIATYPFAPRLRSGELQVTVLDVGQGDSIFAAFPDGRTLLVDGGGLPGSSYVRGVRPGLDVGEDVVSPYLWTLGVKRIDVLALTHADEDHIGGLAAVLRNFRVGELWVGRDADTAIYRALLTEAALRGVPVLHRSRGDSFDWAGANLRVLWPEGTQPARLRNNDALVLRLVDRSESFLLTGDIERPAERGLTDDGDTLTADFLKVPHHGSKTSSTEPFLTAVRPRFAAISVGESNPFGHPDAEVVDRLAADGARVLRTDRDGAITALTDGTSLDVQTFYHSAGNGLLDGYSPPLVSKGSSASPTSAK